MSAARSAAVKGRHAPAKHIGSSAVSRERARIARDLHDGILQVLTWFGFQLAAASRVLESEPIQARCRLVELQANLEDQQQELRRFIQRLELDDSREEPKFAKMSDVLLPLQERIGQQWNLLIKIVIAPRSLRVATPIAGEIAYLISEASVNAARHGKASAVQVSIWEADLMLHIRVHDNGSGFDALQAGEWADTISKDIGPRSIRGRIRSLAGELRISSQSCGGGQLEITFPLRSSPAGGGRCVP